MKIGELAQATRSTVQTVRYYEKEGLLPEPQRTEGNYRFYGADHVERLRFIRNCRVLDMTHQEIRTLLQAMDQPTVGCGSVNTLIETHIQHVEIRINELLGLQAQLIALRQRCVGEQPAETCGILHELSTMEAEGTPHRSHVG